jgi:hypothetical protein
MSDQVPNEQDLSSGRIDFKKSGRNVLKSVQQTASRWIRIGSEVFNEVGVAGCHLDDLGRRCEKRFWRGEIREAWICQSAIAGIEIDVVSGGNSRGM